MSTAIRAVERLTAARIFGGLNTCGKLLMPLRLERGGGGSGQSGALENALHECAGVLVTILPKSNACTQPSHSERKNYLTIQSKKQSQRLLFAIFDTQVTSERTTVLNAYASNPETARMHKLGRSDIRCLESDSCTVALFLRFSQLPKAALKAITSLEAHVFESRRRLGHANAYHVVVCGRVILADEGITRMSL